MARARWVVFAVLGVGACADGASLTAAGSDLAAAVELTTDANQYRAGSTVTVQLNNRSDETVQVGGFCDRPLERLTNSGWVTVDGASGICTAALLLLPPGSSVALSYPTRGVRLSGTYRLRADLRRPGAERPFFQYSNDFSIDAE